MRALYAFLLLGAAVAHECPLMHWLKEHGSDALDTVMECKDVPAAIAKAQTAQCKPKNGAIDKIAIALWYAVTGLEHMNVTMNMQRLDRLKSLAVKKLVADQHDSLVNVCRHEECLEHSKELQAVISPCAASLTCSFMTNLVPFADCKEAYSKYMGSVMDMFSGPLCDTEILEDGKPYYCAQLNSELMLRDVDCFMEMKGVTIGAGKPKCTPKCVSIWEGLKAKLPKCSKTFMDMSQQVYEKMVIFMQDLAKSFKDKELAQNIIAKMPKTIPSYEDKCAPPPPAPVSFAKKLSQMLANKLLAKYFPLVV